MRAPVFGAAVALVMGVVGAVVGCEPTRRVVGVRGGLGLTADERGNMAAVGRGGGGGAQWEALLEASYGPPPGVAIEGERLRRRLPDGSVHLVSRSPRDLVLHLLVTLQRQEHDLLFEQLISEHAKALLERGGRDPRDALAYLVEREAEVRALLLDLRGGADAGNVRLESLGRNRYRLELSSAIAQRRRFRAIEIRLEGGRFRLDDIG